MKDVGAIERSVLAEQVKERLLQSIFDGSYPPDSRIVETRVARELGVSQAPVREALRGLEALGVVEITPFRGARVRRPTSRQLQEAYVVRTQLESLGAGLAVPRLTDEALDGLADLVEEMQIAAGIGDRHAVAIADASFHSRIIEIGGNATLGRVWQSLEPFSRTYITLIAPGADALWTANLHTPILSALRARETPAVVAALHRHFALASARLSEWTESGPLNEGEAPAPDAG